MVMAVTGAVTLAIGTLAMARPGRAAADLALGQWPASQGPVTANQQYGYPYPDAPMCTASPYVCTVDDWYFYQGQCTSWVAYRLNQLNGIGFSDNYRGQRWGNATDWAQAAENLGISVSGAPALGSVAWYAGHPGDDDGHVAYVEEVISPTEVVISEMNYDFANGFRVREISTADDWPTGFIHIADRKDGGSPPPPSQPAPVTASVSASANPTSFGGAVTLTAAVIPQSPGTGTPTGMIEMFDGSNEIGGGSLSSATFSVTISSLSVGTHTISATYSGDSNFSATTSSPFDEVVDRAPTTVALTSSANPAHFGQSVTVSATVASRAGGGVPTGSVQILDGTAVMGSGTLGNGTVTVVLPPLAVGTYSLAASYSGDTNFLASASAAFDQVVEKAPTHTAITASTGDSSGFADPVTFTAGVTVPAPGAGTPSGAETIAVDGTNVSSAQLTSLHEVSLTTSALAPGRHVVSATYEGDADFRSSETSLSYTVTCANNVSGVERGTVVARGSSTCIIGAHIDGGVIDDSGSALAIEGSQVDGAVVADSPRAVATCGSDIGGSVTVSSAHGFVMIGDPGKANCPGNQVDGTLVIEQDTGGFEVIGNTVRGTIVAVGNRGPGPYPGDSSSIGNNTIHAAAMGHPTSTIPAITTISTISTTSTARTTSSTSTISTSTTTLPAVSRDPTGDNNPSQASVLAGGTGPARHIGRDLGGNPRGDDPMQSTPQATGPVVIDARKLEAAAAAD